MYHKFVAPVGAVAAGGGVLGHSVWMIVAGATAVVAGAALIGLLPRLRSR
jgi:hypothetical protein